MTITPAVEPPATTYHEAAQALIEELRRMREKIPHFAVPTRNGGRQTLSTVASLSTEFIELTSAIRANNPALMRGAGTSPAEARDLMAYADAFGPVAAEFEAAAKLVRFSVDAARGTAGTEALTTYALARRLVRRPEHADLAPYVADMRRAFGNRGKRPKGDGQKRPQAAPAATPPASEEK